MTTKHRVFSGMRPTGHLHLGNYFGAIKGYLELQGKKNLDCIYAVVDLHGITSPYNPKLYPHEVNDMILDYLACGLNPKKSHLIIQSHIPEHLELAYYLSTIFPVSRLEQLPTYKEKKLEQPKYINLGLLSYPILMAADILIYKAGLVPVGKDQLPHIELSREAARIFNHYFGNTFPEPQAFLTAGAYIPSLTGEGKMSKTNEGSYISLIDDLSTIKRKIAKVPTDKGFGKKIPEQGGVDTLMILVELFMGRKTRQKYEKQYLTSGIKYQNLKSDLAQNIFKYLEPIQKKRKFYETHPQMVKQILNDGEKYAAKIAKETLSEVKLKMGVH